jgi:predicted phosphoribosyltransferase
MDAGMILAERLLQYADVRPVLLAIPNGGVPVAAVIAEALQVKLGLMIARKLQVPGNPEAGFGAVSVSGNVVLNYPLIIHLGLREPQIQRQREKAFAEAQAKRERFGQRAELPPVAGQMVVLVDDGLATGFTMEAAVESVKAVGVERIIVAVPTASHSAYRRIHPKVDRMICPDLSRLPIFAVANAYENWHDVSEDEVRSVLAALEEKGL